MTRTDVITILNELKPYTATHFQVINLFDKYVRVKRKQLPRILLIDHFHVIKYIND